MVFDKYGKRLGDIWPLLASGEMDGISSLSKFGYNGDVSTSFEPIWDQGGAYTFLSGATTLTASSSDANDASAGTGARTIAVVGLDANWNEVTVTVTMNGQTGVSLTTDLRRVYRVYALTVGSGGVNAGDIYIGSGTITAGVPANIYARITAGQGQTLMAIYTVPAGKRLFVAQMVFTSSRTGTANLDVRGRMRVNEGPWRVFEYSVMFQNILAMPMRPYLVFPGKTDVVIEAKSSTGTLPVGARFSGMLESHT